MSLATWFGITRIGRSLALLGIATAAAASAGVWLGMEWQQGQQAQLDRDTLRLQVERLHFAANQLRKRGVDIAQDFRTAATRMERLSLHHQEQIDALDDSHAAQRDALADYLASRLDLMQCRLGPDGMRLWAAAAGVEPAAASAATHPGDAEGAMPGHAAYPGLGWDGRAAGGLGGRGAPVPPLQDAAWRIERGGERP